MIITLLVFRGKLCVCVLKGLVHPKMKIMSLKTSIHPRNTV